MMKKRNAVLGIGMVGAIGFLSLGAGGFKMGCLANRNKKPHTDPKRLLRAEIRKKNNAYLFSHNPEDIEIITPDALRLRAWYVPAKKETKRFVIAIHGHNCNGPDECGHLFGFYHDDMGFNYFLPDLRGHGRSDGKFIGFGALDYKDINLWIDYLIERFGEDIEIMLHGISMGAATSMLVNNNNPREQVKLIVEDCGFTDAYEQVGAVVSDMLGFKSRITPVATNVLCKTIAKYDLKKDATPLGTMTSAKNPVLFIHGEDDTFVPFEMCQRLYDACPAPKEIFTVPGATHAYSYYDAKEEYDAKVKAFIEKYM